MPKKLYRESPLMPPKPSVICKGYTFFFPAEHKEQIPTFMKSDLYSAPGEWKNKARREAALCERGSAQCGHWLSRLVLDWAQGGSLSLPAAELFTDAVLLPGEQRCADNAAPWQQKSCLGASQYTCFSLQKSSSVKSQLFARKGQFKSTFFFFFPPPLSFFPFLKGRCFHLHLFIYLFI